MSIADIRPSSAPFTQPDTPGATHAYWNRAAKRYGGIVCGLLALGLLFSVLSPTFLTAGNLLNVVLQVSRAANAATSVSEASFR